MAVKFVVSSAAIEALLQSASISEAMVSEAESLRAAAAAAVPVEFGHFTRDGRRVVGRHTLGKLAGSKRARRGGRS